MTRHNNSFNSDHNNSYNLNVILRTFTTGTELPGDYMLKSISVTLSLKMIRM